MLCDAPALIRHLTRNVCSVDTSVSIRGLCSLAMLVVDAEVLRRLESSTSGASSDYSLLLLALIQKCSHAREDVASCACWALSEICESDTSVDIVRCCLVHLIFYLLTLPVSGTFISKSNGPTVFHHAGHAHLDLARSTHSRGVPLWTAFTIVSI